jgi:hypothetical protein
MNNLFTIIIVIVALFSGLFLLGWMQRKGRREAAKKEYSYFEKEFVERKWQEIKDLQATEKPSALKNAVLESDKLLDYVLKGKGYRGATMAERLKSARGKFSDNNGVWSAHKARNRLVHEAGYDFMAYEAKDAIKHFEQALKDLGAI